MPGNKLKTQNPDQVESLNSNQPKNQTSVNPIHSSQASIQKE